MIVNKNDQNRYYIGQTVNLSDRMYYYKRLIDKKIKPNSSSLQEISSESASNWYVIVLGFYPPVVTFLVEQFMIYFLQPKINTSYKVNIVYYTSYNGNVLEAISTAINIRDYYNVDSTEYAQFNNMLQRLNNNYSTNDKTSSYQGKPIYGYSALTYELLFITNSVNSTMKLLNCRWATLMSSIINKTIFNNLFILSFRSLTSHEFKDYQQPKSLEGSVNKVTLIDPDTLEPVITHESLRAMARYYNVDYGYVRIFSRYGYWDKYIINLEPTTLNHEIYRFDIITGEEILPPYKSKAEAALDR